MTRLSSDPYARGSTRGSSEVVFESLHSAQIVNPDLTVAACECCSVLFGCAAGKGLKFCPSHRWLETARLLGQPLLIDISYMDHGQVVDGRLVRWCYRIPCEMNESMIIRDAIRDYYRRTFLESIGGLLPYVHVAQLAVTALDLQRLCPTPTSSITMAGVDYRKLLTIMQAIDESVVSAL